MKKIFKYCALCAMAGMFVLSTSCNDLLEAEPSGKLTEAEMFGNVKSAMLIVNGLYDKNLNAMRGWEFLRTMVGTDEARYARNRHLTDNYGLDGSFDTYGDGLSGNNSGLGALWNNYWAVVVEAGKVVYYLGEDESPEAKQLVAEARFLRALNMFRLSVQWGDIPILDPALEAEYGTDRQPENVVWKYIIDDLTAAIVDLAPESSDSFRATRYAALAMLGKSLMYAPESTGLRNFAEADKCFVEIINSGKYGLVSNYKDLWNNAPFEYPKIPAVSDFPDRPDLIKTPNFKEGGISESLFTVEFTYRSDDSGYNSYQWCTGSWEFETWFAGEASWLSGYEYMVPNIFMYEDVNTEADFIHNYEFPDPVLGPQLIDRGVGVWEDGDQRRDASIRYEWYYYTDTYSEQPALSYGANNLATYKNKGTAGQFKWIQVNERKAQLADNMRDAMNPHIKKFEDFRCDVNTGLGISMFRTHKPFPVIRYADILLLHAECLSEAGNIGEAINVVQNQVRKRAWGDGTPSAWNPASKEQFRDMIMDERMRELAFEGWRRTDLIRTGKFVNLVKSRNDWVIETPGYINENKKHWPVPLSEITEFGWTQNPGYIQ
ncbi:RagB/SusD family nutrient uptake outer membrane protein [Dysgonomonas macrotermitis]|uniref:Starch-binding associating with outer membrane n=1 Tax=Dysgonomonas macrotermitis TaxID=1346286 RepID=A0A1M4XZB7_9BACT|nr:RagB/SusD family nutrient uptake outer membrane protein [Dysgonomonas macrotermitis]SHE98785.1 Starch-binding associating with outer membrane [Dysgonomonas macrotermitis]